MRLTPLGWTAVTALISVASLLSILPVSGQEKRRGVPIQIAGPKTDEVSNAPTVRLVPKNQPGKTSVQKVEPISESLVTGIAQQVAEKLNQYDSLTLDAKLEDLATQLESQWDIPVLVDSNAFAMAELDPSATTATFDGEDQPIRTMLRRILKPLRLTTRIEDEGLVIIPDFTELTRDGIATDRWVSVPQEQVERFEMALDRNLSLEFHDTPLEEVIEQIATEIDAPVVIDKRALEEVGLTTDTPIDFIGNQLPAKSVLRQILQDLELTYSYQNGLIVIGTNESVERQLLSRIYFLEGTGLSRGDYEAVTSLVQSSIQPGIWEALGGSSTIVPIGDGLSGRPSVLITSTVAVHDQITPLLDALRQSTVGPDPIASREQLERQKAMGGMGGGLGGGGMGGGGFF